MKKILMIAFACIAAPLYGAVTEVSSGAEIKEALKSQNPVILIIHSKSCPHCVSYMPQVKAKSDARPNVTFLAVEANQHPDIAKQYKINGHGVPQTIVFENGKKVASKSFAGGVPAKLATTLDSIK